MKKTNCYDWLIGLLFVTFLLPLSSCSKDDDEPVNPTLSVSMSSISIDAEGGQQSVDVTSNTNWIIEGASNWCSVSPSAGNGNTSITIKIEANSAADSRECILTVKTPDEALSKTISVKQNGLALTLSTNPSELRFSSEKSDRKTMQVNCNGEWTITNIPDWIDADPVGGKGDRIVTFTTKSENATSSNRRATVTITAGVSTVNVELTQEAGLSECYVEPEGIVTLASGVAFLSAKHGNVKNYRVGYIKASDYNKFSQKELLELTRNFSAITEFDKVESINRLQIETEYYLLTLAYDMDDKEGELHKASFTTKPVGDAQALVTIGDLMQSDTDIYWQATPDGATDKYYTMFLSGLSDQEFSDLLYKYDDSLYVDHMKLAWYLNNEIERKTDFYKVKKGYAEIQETSGFYIAGDKLAKRGPAYQFGYAVFFTWGVNVSNDKFSGITRVAYAYVDPNSVSKPNSVSRRNGIKDGGFMTPEMFNGKKIKVKED